MSEGVRGVGNEANAVTDTIFGAIGHALKHVFGGDWKLIMVSIIVDSSYTTDSLFMKSNTFRSIIVNQSSLS